jgi:hypothetical protein
LSYSVLSHLKKDVTLRYLLYLVGAFCIYMSIHWQQTIIASPETQSQLSSAMFASLSGPLYALGLSTMVMAALVGRAKVFRFFFGSQSWTMLSHLSAGIFYTAPMVAIYYFLATQHQITVTYYMFVYYFVGNFLFGTMVY